MTKKEIAKSLWEQFCGINSLYQLGINVIKLKRSQRKKELGKGRDNFVQTAKNSFIMYNFLQEKNLIEELGEWQKEIDVELKKIIGANIAKSNVKKKHM